MDGLNVVPQVHAVLDKMADFSNRVRSGAWKGHSGKRIHNVINAAIDEAVPGHALTAALYERFTSRGEAEFADRLLSAMLYEFGGHIEKPAGRVRRDQALVLADRAATGP